MTTLIHPPIEVLAGDAALPGRSNTPHADPRAWARHFDDVYRGADGEVSRVPWASTGASPSLVAWLNAEAPSVVRPGVRAAVVGCGLGHDVVELAGRGYDALGFDVSPAAVEWAARLHPEVADRLVVADLFQLPVSLQRHADLVVEIGTIQSMHPALRELATAAIVSLARPRGVVLAVCRGRDDHEPLDQVAGPPFPLTARELTGLMESNGWFPTRAVDDYLDEGVTPVRRLRAAFRRR